MDISDDRGHGGLCLKENVNDVIDGSIPNQRHTIIFAICCYSDSLLRDLILPCSFPFSKEFGVAAKHFEWNRGSSPTR